MTPDANATALLEWYERYIGEPDAETDVYLGFGLFFVGIALAVVGLALFLWSAGLEAGSVFYWNLRQVAIVLASLGLPAGMVGIVVLLPVDRRALYAAGGGLAVCGLAMAFFVAVYPANWNVQSAADYSAQGIALYAIGLVVVLASTAAALVAYQLERSRPVSGSPETDPHEEVTDERVARDIERAMEDVTLTWGGVRRKETRKLAVDVGTEEIVRSSFDRVEARSTRAAGTEVDAAVASLQGLRGGREKQATGGGTDGQAAALVELRERKRAEALATRDPPLRRLRSRISGLFGRRR
jgi:hypothetical protein